MQTRLKAAVAADSLDQLQRILDCFGSQPAAEAVYAERLRRLTHSGQWLDAEAAVWQTARPNEPAELAKATARVIDVLVQAGRNDEAALGCRWLGRRFADVVCRDGKTVQQWIESLPAENPLRRQLARDTAWPVGKVEIAVDDIKPGNVNINGFGRNAVDFQGDRGPFLSDATIQYDQARRQTLGSDGFGHERWHVSLVEEGQQPLYLANRGAALASACGHLLFLAMGLKVYAIDTLAGESGGGSRILWSHELNVPAPMPSVCGSSTCSFSIFPGSFSKPCWAHCTATTACLALLPAAT